ncbi:uncharacterized protein J8A68_000376 [[Candida] subhashii]|uniref:Protein YTP1-like C-terminal domain-containing protein n=1 Tax=[Candida] subhashii TaxID=561895 RepID=A0A8J5QX78_9ASCO|nr:uncharacterized protein J8A68_000376 [[Candida] subhashii]KAG7666120.1 hypothetical protein J8A68_000376 [[Candida] subhashii]
MKHLLPLFTLLSYVLADGSDDHMMDMDSERVEFHPVNAGSKSFHWILSLFILLIIPSISAVFAFANRLNWSLLLQYISTAYSIFESMFLAFPDSDNHENRTSKGTSWFLSLLLGVTIFLGTLINGSNLIINKFYPHWAKGRNEHSGIIYNTYRTLSFVSVLVGWVRVCMAPVALFGFCYGKHTGQCIAHGIMGSAFIFYSFVLSLVLVIPWIRTHQLQNSPEAKYKSQEFFDSTVMCAWGIVNTFTEHRWGTEAWSMGDYQHTSMGIVWWAGGLLGMFLARNNKRTFIPALLLIFTGYSMSAHTQHLAISTKVHAMFGLALIGGGVSRIIEISFLLRDKACSETGSILSFQYFPPFCLALSGVLFMGATEEQLQLVHDLGSDHSAYILVVSSAAFMIYLWFQLLLLLYLRLVGYNEDGELNKERYSIINEAALNEFELGDISDGEDGEDTPDTGRD